jgi:5,10-methylenetetrahydromethanopterin reductase
MNGGPPERPRLGFALTNTEDVRGAADAARRAERLGYDSLWFGEHNYSHDAIVPCAAAAAATERITIGPCVVPIFTRSALLLANTFATLDELAGGRIVLGIGAGSRVLIKAQGIEYRTPLLALREYVDACRAVWKAHGRHVSYAGEVVRLQDAELDFKPVRDEIPVWIGPTGPKACELTGEIAQGAMLNAFLPASYVRSAVEWLAAGAARTGRSLDDGFETSMIVLTVVARSKEDAFRQLRPVLASYLARLPDVTRHTRLWGEDGEGWSRLVAAVDEGGGQAGQRFISDELIDEITACGTAEECRVALRRYVEAGVDHPLVLTFGDPMTTMEAMAPSGP